MGPGTDMYFVLNVLFNHPRDLDKNKDVDIILKLAKEAWFCDQPSSAYHFINKSTLSAFIEALQNGALSDLNTAPSMWRPLICQSCCTISEYPPSSKEKLIEIIQMTHKVVHLSSYDTDDRTKISDCRIPGAYAAIAYRNTISLLEELLNVLETWFQYDHDRYCSPVEGKEIKNLEALIQSFPAPWTKDIGVTILRRWQP